MSSQGSPQRRPSWVDALAARFDAILFDAGNTLVAQAAPGTPVAELEAELLPGVSEAVGKLRGAVRLGVVSNTTVMDSSTLRRKLSEAGLDGCFEVVVASAEVGRHKPDPAPLHAAIAELGVEARRCLYVGDTEIDREAAAAAGVAFGFTGPHLAWMLERLAQQGDSSFELARSTPRAASPAHRELCLAELDRLAKPPGSLGRLEAVLAELAAITHREIPDVDPVAAAIFVADHEIAQGDVVTPWPWSITHAVAGLLAQGRGLASVMARSSQVHLEVIDVGLATGATPAGARGERVRDGAGDIRSGRTMEPHEVLAALEVGVDTADRLAAAGYRTLCVGEVGIGNTTSAAAIIAWCGGVDPVASTGPGSGIPDDALERKRRIVAEAVAAVPSGAGAMEVLERLAGVEIATMAGYLVGAASIGVPVILDGVVTLAAACLAEQLAPGTRASLLAAHRSPEPATATALALLELEPLVDLGVCTGEGAGAIAVVPLLRAARAALVETARLDQL